MSPLPVTTVGLDDAAGHVLATDVRAPEPMPRWDNSAMDGFAVRATDLAGASAAHPVTLRVLADLPAGTDAEPEVLPGMAARIMTGAPLPPGADAVVPVERTDAPEPVSGVVRIHEQPSPAAHIRRAGDDAAAGDLVLAAGTLLGPAQVAAAASVGCGTLAVHRRPLVAVMSTGSELVTPGSDLRRGQIPDSNSYLLAEAVRAAGCRALRVGAVGDDAEALRSVLDGLEADGVDAVITSGGVSMGAYDVVKEALLDEPGMAFVQIPMQPGKPQGLGRLRGGTPIFALPGNPVSSFVSFEVFVRPALLRLRGLNELDRPVLTCVVEDGWRTPPGRAQYMPVRFSPVDDDADGRGSAADGGSPAADAGMPRVRRAARGGGGSHLVASLAAAQGLAMVRAEVEQVEPGDRVPVMRVDR